jgi:citrate synthase
MSPAEEVKAPPKINRGLFNVYLDLTAISDVDGVRGRLSYRGMAIEQLAGHVPYIDVFHLLVVGRLPSEADRVAMEAQLAEGERLAADLLGCVGDLACGEPLVGLRIALSACGPLR